jgi:hypothetical protein
MFMIEWRKYPSTAWREKIDDSSRLDVVEIARVA